MSIGPPFSSLPEVLRGPLALHWERYQEAAREQGLSPLEGERLLASLARVWEASDFVATSVVQEPDLLADLLVSGDLLCEYATGDGLERLRERLVDLPDATALGRELRRFRRREMVRIAWRDLAGWSGLQETLRDLSLLAESCLGEALGILEAWAVAQWGEPRNEDGSRQGLVVLGMGKLGARELNFSSDIDLIFAFPSQGETAGRGLAHSEFFTRLARQLGEALGRNTDQGFVFRVDTRLRPFGASGPLVMSFDAMEQYYAGQAREWERYAMIKARPVAGDAKAGAVLMATLRPFVYRRYLDYGVFESLREMKAMIETELARKGMGDNVKLGRGGIREVEFIGQVFQLLRGGRQPELRVRGILTVLERLGRLGYLSESVVGALREGYVFLRRVENRLQAWRDQQTHQLPTEEAGRLRLARSMGFAGWSVFLRRLDGHRESIQAAFNEVFAASGEGGGRAASPMVSVWQGGPETGVELLTQAGYQDPACVLTHLEGLRQTYAWRGMSAKGRQRLDRFMPALLEEVARVGDPCTTLERLLGLVERILGRSSYLALLADHPQVLGRLVRLSAASAWISDLLTRRPLLLDELVDPRRLYRAATDAELREELSGLLGGVEEDDLEQQMDRLRQFTHGHQLRVAAAELSDNLPVTGVSDRLSAIAEVVLDRSLDLAWKQMSVRHGVPPPGEGEEAGFAIIAYGKLGGRELGYRSDLDLVFLHDGVAGAGHSRGPRALPAPSWFARLAQRIIHLLDTRTAGGVAYPVDIRLRPEGTAGPLVPSLALFARYQRDKAWTWEHQALVRARALAGDASLCRAFAAVRREVLCRPRDAEILRRDVVDMRGRMRAELGSRESGQFDLKQDAGGIADIEFMVQYGVLRWAARFPVLVESTDTLGLIGRLLDVGCLPRADGERLREAYRVLRGALHRNALAGRSAQVPMERFAEVRRAVVAVWQRLMGDNTGGE